MICIFDIGKTNKKAFLFDEAYALVWERSDALPETVDEDGFPCEDVELLVNWVRECWMEVMRIPECSVRAVNFSAYGATMAHLDEQGNLLTPIYNYLKPFPDDLQTRFYARYGGAQKLARETASPILGSLNSGLTLCRLKEERPEVFHKIRYSLHLPQYLSCLFSGKYYADITSIGCHTHLWDFDKKSYHNWVAAEGILEKLAPLNDEPFAAIRDNCYIGLGLHDSSSALIPYLLAFREPFLLLSTGTWCISLNPFNRHPLTDGELEADCLCYLAYNGKPVKASRLFLGHEHEKAVLVLAEKWRKAPDFYKKLPNDFQLLKTAKENYAADYYSLMSDLVEKQVVSTNLILKNTPVRHIFVDGGFAQNPLFMQLLANAYPDIEVFAATLAQASAIGAALALHSFWNPERPIPENLINFTPYKPF